MKRKERGLCTFDLCLFDSYSIAVREGLCEPRVPVSQLATSTKI